MICQGCVKKVKSHPKTKKKREFTQYILSLPFRGGKLIKKNCQKAKPLTEDRDEITIIYSDMEAVEIVRGMLVLFSIVKT